MSDAQASVRELGIPVKSVNWVRLHAGRKRSGDPVLLATMGQDNGTLFVCDIDLRTGHCTQYEAGTRNANFPTAWHIEPATGVLYVGSAYSGHLHRFDPNAPQGQRRLEDLGPIDPPGASFPCRIDQSPDGRIFIGCYGNCSLTAFDPRTGQFRRHGRMDDVEMYFYPFCGTDGTLAGLVKMCRSHVVAIDPDTGAHHPVGPVIDKQTESDGTIELLRGADGLLYIRSSKGRFRIRGMGAEPVDAIPEPAGQQTRLPDGTTAEFADAASFEFRRLRLTAPDGSARELALDWEGKGTTLFLMHEGPDGRVYGSSILPEHLFSCRPDGSDMKDHGACSVSGGEAYSFANLGGKMYIASYPAARLSIFDPTKPYRFGTDEGANPRDVGASDPISYRPRAMLAGPAGKVWIGSIPDYGTWGGTLASYDPGAGTFAVHRHLIQDCSVVSLAWLRDRNQILVGTSILGGSGTTPRAKACAFVLWDPIRDEPAGTTDFGIEGIHGIPDVIYDRPGRAYAVVTRLLPQPDGKDAARVSELVLLDLDRQAVLDRSPIDDARWPVEVSLRQDGAGRVYGLCMPYAYRIRPGTAQQEVLWRTDMENHIYYPGPIIGRRLFFSTAHRLRCLELPD